MQSTEMYPIETLYRQLIEDWNNRSAFEMAELFTEDGESIGFDGSQSRGRDEIFTHLKSILT
ncbi:uncharacterized protein (TIGR02246 family) [Paenibacillus wynnii]|nr:SgcJ/EcaC family oxidoreductase [Paenibacillus wynnii]MDQ0196878.1 uncharacterized protein (TIGR02246 family) [Paenibacillus wynnii]